MSAEEMSRGGGMIGWFARNPVASTLLMASLVVGGLLTLSRTNSDLFPDIDPRTITIKVAYAGASPEEIASSVNQRAEDAILGLNGIERVRSKAVEGQGTITIELTDFADARVVADEVKSALDGIVDFPPEDAEEAEVTVTSIDSPVIRLVLTGDVGERALREAAEGLERDLLALEEVTAVTLQGARKYEVSIEVPQASLQKYQLTLDKVANAVRAASVNLAGGTLRTTAGNILLRTDEKVNTPADFAAIVVLGDYEGRRLLLGDIAIIRDGFQDAPLINTYNGHPAVFLQISRSENEDSIRVADAVKAFVATYRPPPGVQIHIGSDQTEIIRDRINLLVRNAIMGLALVFVCLALTLDLRLAVWTCVGIPVAFLGGFMIFGQFTTINMTMLLGTILVLGLIVDDAIVVGENIYEEQQKGHRGLAGAIRGASAMAAPVIVGVSTPFAVFTPLLFSSGTLGQLIQPVPLVVIAVLLVSLCEVFLIFPSHLAHGGDWTVGPMLRLRDRVAAAINTVRDRLILPLTRLSVRMPYLVIAAGFAVMLVTVGFVAGGHLRFVFFPVVEGEEINVTLEMPKGTSFEQTEQTMNRVIDRAYVALGGRESELIRSISVTIGGELRTGLGGGGTRVSSETATAKVELVPAGERDLTAAEIERQWREAIGELAGIRSLVFASEGLSGGDDLKFNLSHHDETALIAATDALLLALQNIEGVGDVASTREVGSRQLEFELSPEGAAAGLTVKDLAKQVRQAFYGEEVQRLQRDREDVPVFVRLPQSERRSLRDLARLKISLPNREEADLRTVARISETRSLASIERVDGRRILTVSADVDEAVTTPSAVTAVLKRTIMPNLAADYPGLALAEDGQSRDQAEDIRVLASNLMIGVLVMYVLLAGQLRSYVQPLIILFAVPFGAVGAVWGHILLGYDLSFLSLFGIVALSGVVVNDSVVLIDYFNQLKASEAGSARERIVTAVTRRFRPVLLTTLTTFLGLAPMISETSIQAQFLIPMAVSVGFGILFATFVILLLVPACLAIASPLFVHQPAHSE